ncbi:MAG: SGNH/GDSL hydrolase family protein [Candidatus Erginobacter occultus]|nr:SGNH/GDSL hydrolase family protein [Candidatus Erginobacter occultus]
MALQAGLLGFAGAQWWAMRNNSLYGRGDWIIGKDQGKFVFHTYEYMFQPLRDSMLYLNASMGFQEVLYRDPEDETRRLRRLRAECFIGGRAYQWVILRKNDAGSEAICLSRSPDHPSGYFRYGPAGDLLYREEFDIPSARDVNELDLRFEPGGYLLSLNGGEVRRLEAAGPARGYFGFRGCGNLRVSCAVKHIRLDFEDPRDPEKHWSVVKKFNTRREVRRRFPLLAAGALVLLAWRAWRRRLLGALLPPGPRAVFFRRDDLVFLCLLAVTAAASYYGAALAIPLGIFGAEAGTWILLLIGRKGAAAPGRIPVASGLLFTAVGLILLLGAAARHGRYFGRSRMVSPGDMSYIHLDALHLDPPPGAASESFRLSEPVTLVPGRPFFIPDNSFREQRIEMDFIPDDETTLDLVFQQQTFRTRGDPEGEPILYQRRTLRLSTRKKVASGMSPENSFRLNPVYRINGTVRAGKKNHLELTSTSNGVTVRLNGDETVFPGIAPLAGGETGVMVFENSARIEQLEVSPLGAAAGWAGPTRGNVFPWLWPFAAAVLLLWPADRRDWLSRVVLTAAAAFPALLYLAAVWVLSPGEIFFLGMERVLWMDILLAAAAIAYLFLVLILRRSNRAAPLAFNLAVVALLASVLIGVWDYLPDGHPVKARWREHVILPAGEPAAAGPPSAPWYTDNRRIGANTYMINQQFGGRTIAVPKPEGTIRIFGLGGSQAWGSGAASSDETFYALLGRELAGRGLPVEIYNASVNGVGVPAILNIFRDILLPLEPDQLILDTGLNDSMALRRIRSDPARDKHRQILIDLYGRILDLAAENGIDVILCQEPMSLEMPLRPDPVLYEQLAELTRRAGFPVVSPLAALAEAEPSTFLWWDLAHLTPYGHSLMARLLLPETEAVVRHRLQISNNRDSSR